MSGEDQMSTAPYVEKGRRKNCQPESQMQQQRERWQAGSGGSVADERAGQEREGEDDKPEKTLGAYLYLRKYGVSKEQAERISRAAAAAEAVEELIHNARTRGRESE